MSDPDYYAILGLPPTANAIDVRAATRAMMRQLQSGGGQQQGDAEHFKLLQHACDVLCDADQRRRYDSRQSILRGEKPKASARRPNKNPCAACGTGVYAFELKLHLGRRICANCYRKRKVGGPRVQLRRGLLAAQHLAVMTARLRTSLVAWFAIALPIIAAGGYFAWKRNHRPAHFRPTPLLDATTPGDGPASPDARESALAQPHS